jgi:NAD(P)-dependent dehydrogenase (short-subunit alcohol dehydrogenase family)
VVADSYEDDITGYAAESVVSEITKSGGQAVAVTQSVASEVGVDAMVEAATQSFGCIDILCCFAGNYIPTAFDAMSLEDLNSMLDVHVGGTFLAIQRAYPLMQRGGYGRIVTVSSRGHSPIRRTTQVPRRGRGRRCQRATAQLKSALWA